MKTDKVEIKDSKIHGKGVFAAKDFSKGEKVLHWNASTIVSKEEFDNLSKDEKKYVNESDSKYIIMQEPEKYVNHSCDPNTKFENFCDVAIKDIKKGEEITTDYSNELPEEDSFLCNCGAKNCKRKIR